MSGRFDRGATASDDADIGRSLRPGLGGRLWGARTARVRAHPYIRLSASAWVPPQAIKAPGKDVSTVQRSSFSSQEE